MKKIYLSFALIGLIAISMPVNAQVFDLSSTKKSSFVINLDSPVVYKPSKLIIGNTTKFVVKAEPESHVSLVTSDENSGYPTFHGQNLRLGQIVKPYEAIVGDKGVLELEVPLPSEKELVGKVLYFEVLVWKKLDFSDLKIAKIMGIDGSETNINAVVITEPAKNTSMPGFGPNIPGTGGDFSKAKDIFNKINDTDSNENSQNYYENDIFFSNKPLMLRNIHAPELKTETKKEN